MNALCGVKKIKKRRARRNTGRSKTEKEVVVEAPKAITPAPKPVTRVETPAMAPKPTPVPTPKPVSVEATVELVTPAPVKSLLQLQSKRQHRLLLQNRSDLL